MISKEALKETKILFDDFGIQSKKFKLNIPHQVKTDNDLERWRKDKISKHLDFVEKRSFV